MSRAATGRVLDAIDDALNSSDITETVDWQLSRFDQRSGYDWNVNQPQRCGHCGRDEHHLAITARMERMRLLEGYDPDYRYADDNSAIRCPGSYIPGPVGFRRVRHAPCSPLPVGVRLDDGTPVSYSLFAFPRDVLDQFLSDTLDECITLMRRRHAPVTLDNAFELASRFDADCAPRGLYQQVPTAPPPKEHVRVTLFDRGGSAVRLPRGYASEPVPASEGFSFTLTPVGEGAGFGAARVLAAGGRVVIEDRRDARRRIAGVLDTWTENDDGIATITVRSARRSLPAATAVPNARTRRGHERPRP